MRKGKTNRSDNRRDELCEEEGTEQGSRGTLHEEERVRTRDEDERLRDLGDLEVDDHVDLLVVVVDDVGDAKLVREEGGLDDDDIEDDGTEGEVETVSKGKGEDLSEVPRVGGRGGKNAVEGEGHDGSVVEEGDDEDHERREVKLEGKGHDGETDDDTDGDGASVDRVVAL